MSDPIVAQKYGIAAICQHAASYPDLSVAENIFIGHEFKSGPFIDWGKANREAKKLLDAVGADFSPTASVGSLSVAQQQLVEIAKALSMNAKTSLPPPCPGGRARTCMPFPASCGTRVPPSSSSLTASRTYTAWPTGSPCSGTPSISAPGICRWTNTCW